ncbi:hypothetical protein BGZ70_004866 [Mortierella alpina]|uniref:Uncharacterized protein n=1 Tax=Mortierella alpina TaxID=64518 RepID=A0A9P6M4I8_MORAP|nr:hypothetical protein BGZ70_004866 [Mortierella alpina]
MPRAPKTPRQKVLKVCPLCKTDDHSWYVKKYYISLDSILYMCENLECLYPFHDEAILDASLKRLKVPVYVDNSVTASSSAGTASSSAGTSSSSAGASSSSAGTSSSSAGTSSSSAGTSSSSTGTSSSTRTTSTTTSANAAAEPATGEEESAEATDTVPAESTEDDEEFTDTVQSTLAESAKATVPAPLESSPAHSLSTSSSQTSAVNSTSTTQPIMEPTSQSSNQVPTLVTTLTLPPVTLSLLSTRTSAESTTSSSFVSASSRQPDAPMATVTPKRKRSCSEDADVEDDLTVDEPSHKKRSPLQ